MMILAFIFLYPFMHNLDCLFYLFDCTQPGMEHGLLQLLGFRQDKSYDDSLHKGTYQQNCKL